MSVATLRLGAGDNDSLVVAAMQLIPAVYMEAKTWCGRIGNAVIMKVGPPKTEGGTRWVRNFSSVFKRFKMQRSLYCRNRKEARNEFLGRGLGMRRGLRG
jgi:hypothetical protein